MAAKKAGIGPPSHAGPRSLPAEKKEARMKGILDPRLLSGRRVTPFGDPLAGVPDRVIDPVEFPGSKYSLAQQTCLESCDGKWPMPSNLPWAPALGDELPLLQPVNDHVITNLKDEFCNCISAFEHQMLRCPGHNFFANWEILAMICGKIFIKRTAALQEIFCGYPFVQDGPYRNTDYSNPTAWDALHQQPSVLLKWLLRWWNGTRRSWDLRNKRTTREQIAELRGQAFTMAVIYIKLVNSGNQQKIYGAPFQEEDVKIMRRMVSILKEFVVDIDAQYIEPEEFHQAGHLGHIGPRRQPPFDNQNHGRDRARYDPIAAMMDEVDHRHAIIRNQVEEAVATGDTTEEELSDEEPGVDQKGCQKAGANNGKVELATNFAIAEDTVAARVRGRRRPVRR